MREKTSRTLRRGPKYPLPVDNSESTYYSIDTTDDIYGTNLLPSQRCYIDPWDLENYDYVRKKIDSTSRSTSYYDPSMSPSPAGEPVPTQYFYMPKAADFDCMDCLTKTDERTLFNTVKYDEYPEDEDPRTYNTYGGRGDFDSSSPSERNSSCGEESVSTLGIHTPGFRAMSRRRGLALPKPEPKIDYPTAAYDYCSPYGETSYSCSFQDCYECLSQNQNALLYSSPSSTYGSSFYGSTLGSRSASLYSNTYGNKFGLSKKGLLQIDYSCSWNDLDRAIGRNY